MPASLKKSLTHIDSSAKFIVLKKVPAFLYLFNSHYPFSRFNVSHFKDLAEKALKNYTTALK